MGHQPIPTKIRVSLDQVEMAPSKLNCSHRSGHGVEALVLFPVLPILLSLLSPPWTSNLHSK